jgi:aspartyl-tRNA(Asn)/glutamyl-tRNA(Gln) amidotransferase subunit B
VGFQFLKKNSHPAWQNLGGYYPSFDAMWDGEGSADDIIATKGLKQMTDTGAIEQIVDEIIKNNASQVAQFKSGNEKILGFFVGQAMKATQGKANPKLLNELLRSKLGQ